MKDFAKILSSKWLIDPTYVHPMFDRIRSATPGAIEAAIQAYRDPQPQIVGDIAVINCSGPITHRCSAFSMWYGSATIEGMQQQFRMALQDPAIKTIVFRVDSPGGVVDMVPEFAEEIFAARDIKPVIAVADTMIASAATWLFTGASSVIVPKSGQIGSIGVYLAHFDYSKMLEDVGIKVTFVYAGEHKIDGNPYQELSESAKSQFQSEVDDIFKDFNATVARNRGVTKQQVLETFGQGLMFNGQKAVKIGLADKVSTFDAVVGKLQGRKRGGVQAAETVATTDGLGNTGTLTTSAGGNTTSITASFEAAKKTVEPDEDGNCPEGYEKRDGQCHPVEKDEEKEARAAIDREHVNIAAALAE